MGELHERAVKAEVLVDRGFVVPLSGETILSDVDMGTLAEITTAMTNTGYEPVRSTTVFEPGDKTVEQIALANLFDGGAERSLDGYSRHLASEGSVIGPYVRKYNGQEPRYGLAIWRDLRAGLRRRRHDISWGIIGAGTIGSRVIEQLSDREIADRSGLSIVPDFVLRKSGLFLDGKTGPISGEQGGKLKKGEQLPDVDMLFVATPGISGPESPAYRHIVAQLERRGLVVTAEKASLAEYFAEFRDLSDNFARLGINATVGGGTRLLDIAERYTVDPKNVTEAHFALNGTLAFILGQVANGEAAGVAVDQAVSLGYAEPEASGVIDVMTGEATGDIPRKLAVLMNKLFLRSPVQAEELTYALEESDIRRALREATDRRFIVSVFNANRLGSVEEVEQGVVGGFTTQIEEWVVVGGFQRVRENPLTRHFADHVGAVAGASIGLGPQNQDGVYMFHGPGAGPKPTANAMLDDAQVLIARQREKQRV